MNNFESLCCYYLKLLCHYRSNGLAMRTGSERYAVISLSDSVLDAILLSTSPMRHTFIFCFFPLFPHSLLLNRFPRFVSMFVLNKLVYMIYNDLSFWFRDKFHLLVSWIQEGCSNGQVVSSIAWPTSSTPNRTWSDFENVSFNDLVSLVSPSASLSGSLMRELMWR